MNILFITYEGIDDACPWCRAFWPAMGLELAGHSTQACLLKNYHKKVIEVPLLIRLDEEKHHGN